MRPSFSVEALRVVCRRVLRWWFDELKGAAEDWVLPWLSINRVLLNIHIDGGFVEARLVRSRQKVLVRRIECAQGDYLSALRSALEIAPEHIDQLILHLGDHFILRQILTIPIGARHRVKDIVALQIERVTPFVSEDIDYLAHILDEDQKAKKLRVELTVVARRKMEPIIQILTHRANRLKLMMSDYAGRGRVLREVTLGVQSYKQPLPERVLGVSALVLSSVLVIGNIYAKYSDYVDTRNKIDALQPSARAAELMRERLDRRIKDIEMVVDSVSQPSGALVLAKLSQAFSDDAWAFEYQQVGGEVTITGEAKNSAALVAAISKEALFDGVALKGVQPGEAAEKERFTLSLGLLRRERK